MVTLASIDHIRRPTLDIKRRAELHQHLVDLAAVLHAHDQQAIQWAGERRRDLRADAAHPRLALGSRLLPGPDAGQTGRATAAADQRRPDPPARATAPDHLPGDSSGPRAAGPSRAAQPPAPVRLRVVRPSPGQGAGGCDGARGSPRTSAPAPAGSLRGLAQLPPAATPAAGAAGAAAQSHRPAPALVPGALVARRPRRRPRPKRIVRTTWRPGTGLEIGEDVVDRLEADREADELGAHPGGELLSAVASVGGRGRMDGQAADVADLATWLCSSRASTKRLPASTAREPNR